MSARVLDQTVAEMQRRFALNLHRAACDEAPERNVFLSPFSIWLVLAAAWAGAEGDTKVALAETLGFGEWGRERVSDRVPRFLFDLQCGASIRIGTSIWGRQDISFREEFLLCARNAFWSEVFSRDFGDPAVLDEINAWVRQKTGGRIDRLLEGLSPGLMLTLINAVAFKGAWEIPFDKNQTTDEAFTLANGSTVMVPMMRRSGEFAYFETSMFQACKLPYGDNGSYSMYIVLPKQDFSLRHLHDELTPALWDKMVQPISANRRGTVSLPRFRIDAGCELSAQLSRLGLATVFSARADFSAMADSQSPLYFDQVIHKVFVDVNEEGTEVAAATGLEMLGGMFRLDPAPPFMMKVDRPFFCAIGSVTGAAMFLGAVYNPIEAR